MIVVILLRFPVETEFLLNDRLLLNNRCLILDRHIVLIVVAIQRLLLLLLQKLLVLSSSETQIVLISVNEVLRFGPTIHIILLILKGWCIHRIEWVQSSYTIEVLLLFTGVTLIHYLSFGQELCSLNKSLPKEGLLLLWLHRQEKCV